MNDPAKHRKTLLRLAFFALAVWTAANLVISARLKQPVPAPEDSVDPRTAVVLPAGGRDAVLAEMRLMLGSVHGVLDGAARSDTAAIRAAAAASGLVMAADPALEKVLPPAFLTLGMSTHMAFDTLAAHATAGPAAAIEGLSRITASCIACHAAFRLEVR